MITLHVREGRLHIEFDRLSAEQAGALVSDREVAVSAGAGAGKTSTLAARYVTLLQRLVDEGNADIAQVLVLTFTEKAAQEMRERCYATTAAVARQLRADASRLRAEGLSERAFARLRAGWEALRDRFAGAAISTFHGFCARVLREFPAETGTPPGFTILEEGDATAAAELAVAGEIDSRLAAGHPIIGLLLHTFGGRAALVAAATALVRARGEVGPTLADHHAGRITEATLLSRAPLAPDAARRFLEDEWRPFVDRLLSLTAGIVTPFLTTLAEQRVALSTLPGDPLALYEAYAGALSCLCGSSGALRTLSDWRSTGKKADWGARHAAAKPVLADLQAELSTWAPRLASLGALPNRHDRTLLEVLASMSDVVLAACDRLGAALRAARAVDFTELQLRVRAAIASAESPIAAELRSRHRFLMVDEFQDTDGLQWSIVEALARPDGPGGDRLFFVGDVKQAIYGFRGGDVQVFNAARASVGHAVELSTNYRSRTALITFFNRLFADVLGPDVPGREPWEAPFAALSAGRADPGGSVRIATYEARGTDASREAAWIAGLLADEILVEQGAYAGLHLSDLARHPSPPVAILLRRRRHLLAYEAALRARGIAYVVVGGVGFWGRPEVVDIGNLLHALARRDTISLVAALRSPLFGLTDQDLVDLARAHSLRGFAEGPLPDSLRATPRIPAAHSAWQALARLRDHVSVGELVQAIVVRTRQAWLQGFSAPGGRGAANLERLLALADRHEQRGGTLDAFAARVLARIEADAADAEAAIPDTAARVALLTVHASKGLEYPVVVVPDLGARWSAGGDARGVLRRRVGDRWELACAVPDRHAPIDRLARPGLLGRLRAHGAAVEAAEARRLFYVACTRARDHLVLVGSRRAAAPELDRARSWADLLQGHRVLCADVPEWLVPVDLGGDRPPAPEVLPAPAPLPPPPADLAQRLAPLPTRPRIEVPPSSLALFAEEPEAWYLRHVLRIPELAVQADAAPGQGATVAAVRGEVLHGLLEDNLLDDLPFARARWAAAAYGAGLDDETVAAGWLTVAEQLEVLRGSADVAAVLAAPGYAEQKVRLVRGAVTMDGQIDRLCRDPVDGAWMVVDYKTVRTPAEEGLLLEKYRPQLLAYSAAASRVLEANAGERVRRAAVLFTRTGRLVRLPDWTDADFAALDTTLAAVATRLRREGVGGHGDYQEVTPG
jgi:ATP-dependent helicase/nuclease subunit A